MIADSVLDKEEQSVVKERDFSVVKTLEKNKVHGEVVMKLVSAGYYVDRKTSIVDLAQDFGYSQAVTAVAVVDERRRLLGIVVRRELFDILGKPYGRDVMKHKTVERVMARPVVIDKDRNVFSISTEMEKEFRDDRIRYFALTDDGGVFHGLFTSRDMLVYLSDITQKDIELARSLQMSIVKERIVREGPDYCIAGGTSMAKGVGGDFYDVKRIDDKRWLMTICDVSGKGVAASLVTTSISGMYGIYDFAKGVTPFIVKLNDYIAGSFDSQKFVTGIFVEFDETTGEVKFYDMGHSYIYVYRAGKFFRLKTSGTNIPMGVMPDIVPAIDRFALEDDDLLLLITDGIAEQNDPAGIEYGDNRIAKMIKKSLHKDTKAVIEAIFKDIKEFRGNQPQHDDMTIIALHYRGKKLTKN